MAIRVGQRFVETTTEAFVFVVDAEGQLAALEELRGRDRTLMALSILGGEATQRAICDLSGADKGNVSRNICALAEAGLVDHDPAEWGVRLTAAGWAEASAKATT